MPDCLTRVAAARAWWHLRWQIAVSVYVGLAVIAHTGLAWLDARRAPSNG